MWVSWVFSILVISLNDLGNHSMSERIPNLNRKAVMLLLEVRVDWVFALLVSGWKLGPLYTPQNVIDRHDCVLYMSMIECQAILCSFCLPFKNSLWLRCAGRSLTVWVVHARRRCRRRKTVVSMNHAHTYTHTHTHTHHPKNNDRSGPLKERAVALTTAILPVLSGRQLAVHMLWPMS